MLAIVVQGFTNRRRMLADCYHTCRKGPSCGEAPLVYPNDCLQTYLCSKEIILKKDLIIQAIMCYIPRAIWKMREGGLLLQLAGGMNPFTTSEIRETKIRTLVHYMFMHQGVSSFRCGVETNSPISFDSINCLYEWFGNI